MAGSGRSSRAYDKQDTQRRGGVLCTPQRLQRGEDGWRWEDVEDIDEEKIIKHDHGDG
jgi:hypothetical protein